MGKKELIIVILHNKKQIIDKNIKICLNWRNIKNRKKNKFIKFKDLEIIFLRFYYLKKNFKN